MTTKRNRGRPTRRAASEAALADMDLSNLDPVAVLRSIAADTSAPASARVAAAKALLADSRGEERLGDKHPGDAVSRHALRILKGGRA